MALYQTSSKQAVSTIGWGVERQHFEGAENSFELRGKSRRSFLCAAITQFRGNNDAGTDLGFPNLSDLLRYWSVRIAHEVGDDVGIDQIAHYRSTGSLPSSTMYGNFSCIVSSLP